MKHDLLDLIDYHEKQVKRTKKAWNTENLFEKDEHYFHVRSVELLTKLKEELYGK
jgi:hypothetical protein